LKPGLASISDADFREMFDAHEVAQEALELGWIPISIETLVRMAARLGWPLGAFFRDARDNRII